MDIKEMNKLTTTMQKNYKQMITMKKVFKWADAFIYILYFALGIFFIYFFKDIIFYNKKNISLNEGFDLCKILVFTVGGILIISQLRKSLKLSYKKTIDRYMDSIPKKVCTCTDPCNCRKNLINDIQSPYFLH